MESGKQKDFSNRPVCSLVQRNNAVFACSAKTGTMLLCSARQISADARDRYVHSRMSRIMRMIIEKDRQHGSGLNIVMPGGIPLLRGFDFNLGARLTSIFFAPFSAAIDRAAGTATITIPAFDPQWQLKCPAGATHVTIVSGAAEINFETGHRAVAASKPVTLPLDKGPGPAITLRSTFTANSTHPVFLLLGVRFTLRINDRDYKMKAKAFTPLSIIEVSTAP